MPQNDALETSLVILEILRAIPKRRFTTAVQVQNHLQASDCPRSIRSVQRLLDQLASHFPIEVDTRSKPYGYRWRSDGSAFHLPLLSPAEAVLLRLAENQVNAFLPSSMNSLIGSLFMAARKALEGSPKQSLHRRWLRKVRRIPTTQPLLPPQIRPSVMEAISNGLYFEKKVQVRYINVQGVHREATIWPLGLALQEPRLYLVCRFEGYSNERILALSRIQQATLLEDTFPYPPDFNLAQYDGEGRFAFGEGKQVRIELRVERVAGWYLTESPLSSDQQVEIHPEWLDIRATVIESHLLHAWLRGLGPILLEVHLQPLLNTSTESDVY